MFALRCGFSETASRTVVAPIEGAAVSREYPWQAMRPSPDPSRDEGPYFCLNNRQKQTSKFPLCAVFSVTRKHSPSFSLQTRERSNLGEKRRFRDFSGSTGSERAATAHHPHPAGGIREPRPPAHRGPPRSREPLPLPRARRVPSLPPSDPRVSKPEGHS